MEQEIAAIEASNSLLVVRLYSAAAWLWFAVASVFFSDPAQDVICWLLLAGLGGLLGLTWLVVTKSEPSLLRRPFRVWWLSVPVAYALGSTFLMTELGVAVRVALCEKSLNRFVADVTPETKLNQTRWVGLFQVERVSECEGGVYLFTGSSGLLSSSGVAHIPTGTKIAQSMWVHHLYGEWYSFEWKN